VCKQVDQVLAKTGTRRMIMGHTPDFHASSLIRDKEYVDNQVSFFRISFQDAAARSSSSILVNKTHSFQ
jgi:hypothetical protein